MEEDKLKDVLTEEDQQENERIKKEKKQCRKDCGINLIRELDRLGLSQAEASRRSGLPKQMIHKLIKGTAPLDPWKIYRLMKIGVKPENVFKGFLATEPEEYDGKVTYKRIAEYPADYVANNPEVLIDAIEEYSIQDRIEKLMKIVNFCMMYITRLVKKKV